MSGGLSPIMCISQWVGYIHTRDKSNRKVVISDEAYLITL